MEAKDCQKLSVISEGEGLVLRADDRGLRLWEKESGDGKDVQVVWA